MAASAARESKKKTGDVQSYLIGAVKIYKGSLVNVRVADGYAYPGRNGTATDTFVGVAYETVDNSAGSAGGTRIRVEKVGSHVFALSTAVQVDLGQAVYISDDITLTRTSTNAQLVGYVQEIIDGSNVRTSVTGAR